MHVKTPIVNPSLPPPSMSRTTSMRSDIFGLATGPPQRPQASLLSIARPISNTVGPAPQERSKKAGDKRRGSTLAPVEQLLADASEALAGFAPREDEELSSASTEVLGLESPEKKPKRQ